MSASTMMALDPARRVAADRLVVDLRRVFGERLSALVAYGLSDAELPLHTLALLERVTFADLTACAPQVERWRQHGLAVPLILSRDEFHRSLDVFPLEYGEIVSHHVVLVGDTPFEGVRILDADLRRACELQAKSHLIHLREGFLETGGQSQRVARLIAASAPSLRGLLDNLTRLDASEQQQGARIADDESLAAFAQRRFGISESLVRDVLALRAGASTIADPTALLQRYIVASEQVWTYVDGWKAQ